MRTFTEKDKMGLARALQTFCGFVNTQKPQVKVLQVQVERALDEGVTVDELFNPANYGRLAEIKPSPTITDYIDALISREIVVRPLKEDEFWDMQDNVILLSMLHHDFYTEIFQKGGTWSTLPAKKNLVKAIKRNTLQGILSEKLINEIASKTENFEELTCYQYIAEILKNQEDYAVDNGLTEAQSHRAELLEATETDFLVEETSEEATNEVERENKEEIGVTTEPAGDNDDKDIWGDDFLNTENVSDMFPGAFMASVNPHVYKQSILKDAIMGLTVNELYELGKGKDLDCTIDELVTSIVEGKYDKDAETMIAKNAHQYLNGELFEPFQQCVRLQGIEMDDESILKLDLLLINWDLRDNKSRKLQKIRDLIIKDNNIEDEDLQSVLKDLEKLYSKEE